MFKKYLKSIEWIKKNEQKMIGKTLEDFHEFEARFDAWVATQKQDDQNCIESTIKAVRLVFQVFPEAKIKAC